MQLIKKYGNRKLYHTNEKRYITLEGIAELIQSGAEVRVLDNVTGEDITISTLSQILLQSKGRHSLLPIPFLAGLIQTGGDTISNLRRSVITTLGGRTIVDAEIRLRLQRLLDEGKLSEEEVQRVGRLLLQEREGELGELAQLPTRNDIERLRGQVEELAALVDDLLRQRGETSS